MVCIGARDDRFGKVVAPLDGYVRGFKLVYVQGDGLSYFGDFHKGYWGGTHLGASTLQIVITNNTNNVFAPQGVAFTSTLGVVYYSLPGVTNMDPVLLFPGFVHPFFVKKNQSLRIWFLQDMANFLEFDNYGTTCAELKIMYV
jgi:hypothetical protein